MIYLSTFCLFLVWSVLMWIGFTAYAKILLKVGQSDWFAKIFLIQLSYILFAIFLISPFFAIALVDSWKNAFAEDSFYIIFSMCCYAFIVIPNYYYFSKKYLPQLKKIGVF